MRRAALPQNKEKPGRFCTTTLALSKTFADDSQQATLEAQLALIAFAYGQMAEAVDRAKQAV